MLPQHFVRWNNTLKKIGAVWMMVVSFWWLHKKMEQALLCSSAFVKERKTTSIPFFHLWWWIAWIKPETERILPRDILVAKYQNHSIRLFVNVSEKKNNYFVSKKINDSASKMILQHMAWIKMWFCVCNCYVRVQLSGEF